ncbi:MAG: TonB-dependent receptor [Bacteroidales bacterium]|nr:TonB-dependent receptor [Bacteroidales bacterium]
MFLLLLICFVHTSYGNNANFLESEQQSSIKITGTVIDKQNDDPLIGATVKIKGIDKATITDLDGNFSIEVPYSEATLVFSYIGYQPLEYPLKGQTNVTIYMIEDSKALEEVVVVGYSKQRKETMVGAVAMVTTKDLQQSPTANINNALAGRLPGLIANQYRGGEPGVDKAEIFIRGKSTFNDQDPIVIVDGVERDMSYLSADEIETFTILKDASATAQYGIRGANGVVVITTKRGQASEKPTVNFKASFGINKAAKFPSYLGSADYAMLYNEARDNDILAGKSAPNGFTDEAIEAFRRGEGYDWDYFDYAFKSAMQQDYTLSIRGGSDIASYYVMANYFDQGTNMRYTNEKTSGKDSGFKRYNIRANIDVNITKNFWAKFDVSGRVTDRTSPGTSAGKVVNLANTQPPYLPITLDANENEGNEDIFKDNPKGVLFGTNIYRYNILGELTRTGYQNEKNTYFEGAITLGHNLDFILPGLKVEGMFSYDMRSNYWVRRDVNYYKDGYREYPGYATFEPLDSKGGGIGDSFYMDPTQSYTGVYGGGNKHLIDENNRNDIDRKDEVSKYYAQFRLEYAQTFADKHDVSALFLANRNERRVGKDPYYRYQGMTGRATYYYEKKYLFEFNFGYNGSENFARGSRYGFFPSGSIGWVVTSENFMDGTQSWLDFLKLRASYGLVGSDKINSDRYPYLAFFEGGDAYRFGPDLNTEIGGTKESRMANPAVGWEKAKKMNVGIDITMLQQRLSFNIDFFKEWRYNILTDMKTSQGADIQRYSIPDVVGKDPGYANLSKIDNYGFDFELSWQDRIGKDFSYYIKPNFSFARNKIKYTAEIDWGENTWRQATGRSMGTNFCYVFDHFVADQAEADALNESNYQSWGVLIPGDAVYKDMNGDGVIDEKDRAAMGYPRSPEIMFGLPIGFQYKDFDFSVLFQGAANSSILLRGAAVFDFPNFDQDKMGKVKPMHMDRWTPETASTAKYPALHLGTDMNNKNERSSLFLYDAKYVRLKNIEVGYSVPHKIIKKAGLQQVRVYAQAQNLLTWDKLGDVDVDPETSSDGTWYPIQKTFNFGVNITF